MKEDLSDDLLIRHVLGETTPTEEQEISVWVKADSANAKKLEQFKFILENSKQLANDSPADEEAEWEKFKANRDANRDRGNIKILKPFQRWLQVAASILVICGLAAGGYMIINHTQQTADTLVTVKTRNNVLTDTLPDGSTVQLNKNSAIAYAKNFRKRREVRLTGEAFFTVVHNENAPFTVYAGNVNIRDIGTSFNVKSKQGYLEVIVETGVVKVSRQTASVVLKQREMICIAPTGQNFTKQASADLLYNYYRYNQFELNNTPLSRIVAVFNEIYGARIRIEGQGLNNIPITVRLKKDSLDQMLRVLLLTTPEIKMKKSGDDIILEK